MPDAGGGLVERAAERLAELARLLPTDTGANVVLAHPFGPIVFDRLRTDGNDSGVSVARTAIDLLSGNARMLEEGEALLEWMGRSALAIRQPGRLIR